MLDLNPKSTVFSKSKTLRCGDKLLSLSQPAVMGILNLTPDSFYEGSRCRGVDECVEKAGRMIEDGASVIDLGAMSTRPGAAEVSENEECDRLMPVLTALVKNFSKTIISVDTFRPGVAVLAAGAGAGMINDISAGDLGSNMFQTIAGLDVAYVLMHMKGTPADMQKNPEYEDVTTEVYNSLSHKVLSLQQAGVSQVVIDPGFGFGKTLWHNYTLLRNLNRFTEIGVPLLVGVSRKSMIYRLLDSTPAEALNGTTVINTIALLQGADILRVHDVKEAAEAIKIFLGFRQAGK